MIKEKNLKILFDTGTLMRYMSKEQALKMNVNIPKNYKIGNLSEQWLEKINSVWPHRGDESTEYLGYLMKHNVSVGIFDENGELAAWCLQNDTQSLAALQTDENHSRKGLAVAAVQLICKKIAEENDVDIHTNIVHTNIPSMKLFEKLGFENIQDNFWISIQEQK
jgi:RimJ/RimL family protein N-acetyltransferase